MKLSSKSSHPRKRNKEKGKKKTRDRVKDIKISEIYGKYGSVDHSGLMDVDIWGMSDCLYDIDHMRSLAVKCRAVRRRSVTRLSEGLGSKTMVGQVQKWRQSRLKSQLNASFSRLAPRLRFAEESIRLWLEAIVIRKWNVRYDALTLMNELDASIALHEYKLDMIDDHMDECKALAITLKTQCNLLASMMIFHECVLEETRREVNRVAMDIASDPDTEKEEDEAVFQGYTAPAAGMPLSPKTLSSNPLVHLYQEGYQDYKRSRSRSESLDTEGVHADIARKFEQSIELINRCNEVQDSIRARRSKEMVEIAIANKTKATLKQLCGFSSVGSGGELDEPFPNDGQRLNCASSNYSGGDVTRGVVSETLMNKKSQKSSLRAVRDCIDHLQMLVFLEKGAKDALVKVTELKNEVAEIKQELALSDPDNFETSSLKSLTHDIVWGCNNVPAPIQNDVENSMFCRCSSCYKEFLPPRLTADQHKKTSDSLQLNQEEKMLKYLETDLSDAKKSQNDSPGLYLKEFTAGELTQLLAQLETNTLLVHTINDKFSSEWYEKHTATLAAAEPSVESSSRGSESKSETQDQNFLGQPFLRFDSDISTIDDTTPLMFPVGCGLLWDGKSIKLPPGVSNSCVCRIPVGLRECVGVFSSTLSYQNILRALSLRDYISTESGTHLPVVVYIPSSNSFLGLNRMLQHKVLREFLRDCSPTKCTCSAPCTYPSIPPDSPPTMRLRMDYYSDLEEIDKTRMFGAWQTSDDFLKDIFSASTTLATDKIAKHILHGFTEAVASANAMRIVCASTASILKVPQLKSLGELFLDNGVNNSSGLSVSSDIVHDRPVKPLEDSVRHVSSLVVKYESPISVPVPHAELMVPLGAVRIMLAANNKQTEERVNEICVALARWIDLSCEVAFRLLGSVHTPSSDVTIISSTDCSDTSTTFNVFEDETKYDPKVPPLPPVGTGDKNLLNDVVRRRIPILDSVTVSCRTELYHDIMNTQIRAIAGRAYNDIIFNSDFDSGSTFPTRRSHQFNRQSGVRVNEHTFSSDEQIELLVLLCRLMCSHAVDYDEISSSKGSASLQSVRNNLRFHVLQYLLGLDERWSLKHTADVCAFVLERVEEYRSTIHTVAVERLSYGIVTPSEPFRMVGRASKILSQSAVHVIAQGFPDSVLGLNCNIRYSLEEDKPSLIYLSNVMLSKPYKACMLVVQDTMGYVFGGFVNGEFMSPSKAYFGSGDSFVFKALPCTKIYPWTERNELFAYFSNFSIGMGGGGEGFAFMLNEDMSHGMSAVSDTYGNRVLSFMDQFTCAQFEFWVFEDDFAG